jgi:hypothetical protein
MQTRSEDLKISGTQPYEVPLKMERGILTLTFTVLFLAQAPILIHPILKPPVGIILALMTLPALLAVLTNKVKVPGRGILLVFLLVTLLNIFNPLAYHGPILRWFRMAFCSYIFVAMVCFVVTKLNTPNRRYYAWLLLVIFITLNSFLDFFVVAKLGLGGTFDHRAAGDKVFTLTALMLLFPIFGTAVAKKNKWLKWFFYSTLLLLLLSGSRGNFLVIGMATLYSFMFVQKRFTSRISFLLMAVIIGGIIISTPIYDRMSSRFEAAAGGEDDSTNRRLEETQDAIAEANKTWATLFFGKGYGTKWKSRHGELPGGYSVENAHSDYATRLLYCGLVGLVVQIFLYIVIGLTLRRAIIRAKMNNVDVYTMVRLHGALLVILCMAMIGFAGGVFYSFNNNIYQAVAIGLGLGDAAEIFSMPTTQKV